MKGMDKMNNLEKVEKLREKANISYEEAKAILEECEWDLLDAVVILESRGKIKNNDGRSFCTKNDSAGEEPKNPQQVIESYQSYEQNKKEKNCRFFDGLWKGVKFLFKKGCENKFLVKRNGNTVMDIPVLLLIVLMICFFWALLILMAVSLFFGFSYNFTGPDLGRENVNDIMNKASRAAENLKSEVKEYDTDATYAKNSDKINKNS